MGIIWVYVYVGGGVGKPLHQMMVVHTGIRVHWTNGEKNGTGKGRRGKGNMGTATTHENDPGASIAIAVIFYFK